MDNKLDRAIRHFDRIPGNIEEKEIGLAAVLTATRGLLRMRSGQIGEGIHDYNSSIQMSLKANDYDRAIVATAILASELKDMGRVEEARKLMSSSEIFLSSLGDQLSKLIYSRIQKKIS